VETAEAIIRCQVRDSQALVLVLRLLQPELFYRPQPITRQELDCRLQDLARQLVWAGLAVPPKTCKGQVQAGPAIAADKNLVLPIIYEIDRHPEGSLERVSPSPRSVYEA
jgi:hypothetical protein